MLVSQFCDFILEVWLQQRAVIDRNAGERLLLLAFLPKIENRVSNGGRIKAAGLMSRF